MPPIDTDRLLTDSFVARAEQHDELPSTQDRARQAAAESGSLPLLVVAGRQTAGRGRGSNTWWTGPGGLAFSLLFDPAEFGCPRRAVPRLSLAVGVAVVDTVTPLIVNQRVGLRWPNDVYVADRKLAGVLTEVLPDGRHIVGIGLNVNNRLADAPAELRERVATLRDLTGREHQPTELLLTLLSRLAHRLRQLGAEDEELAVAFDTLCLQHGEQLTLFNGSETVVGICTGIGRDGALLETPKGRQAFYSGTLQM